MSKQSSGLRMWGLKVLESVDNKLHFVCLCYGAWKKYLISFVFSCILSKLNFVYSAHFKLSHGSNVTSVADMKEEVLGWKALSPLIGGEWSTSRLQPMSYWCVNAVMIWLRRLEKVMVQDTSEKEQRDGGREEGQEKKTEWGREKSRGREKNHTTPTDPSV